MFRTAVLSIALLYLPVTASLAHHSAAAFFDEENLNEFGGEVTSTRWRNPHVVLGVIVTDADGQNVEWSVESNSLNALERIGISPDTVTVGDEIRVWGPISRHGLPSMRAYNIAFGQVLMMPHVSTERRWDDRALLSTTNVLENKDVTESIQ